jgi:peroxiredoxin Q/BCP
VRDNLTSLRRHQIEPIGVNHGSAESHEAFRAELDLPFPLLVDEGMAVATAYGAVKEDGSGISRSVVVVGKDGNVVFSEPGAPASARIVNAVNAAADEGATV